MLQYYSQYMYSTFSVHCSAFESCWAAATGRIDQLIQSGQYKILFSLSYTISNYRSPLSSKLGQQAGRATSLCVSGCAFTRICRLMIDQGGGGVTVKATWWCDGRAWRTSTKAWQENNTHRRKECVDLHVGRHPPLSQSAWWRGSWVKDRTKSYN